MNIDEGFRTTESSSRQLMGRLIDGGFAWQKAQVTSLPEFLSTYTLHDSYWIGLWLEPHYVEAIAAIRWDTSWTKGRVPYPGSKLESWPALLIKFNKVYKVVWHDTRSREFGDKYPDVISDAKSRYLTQEELRAISEHSLHQHLQEKGDSGQVAEQAVAETVIIGNVGGVEILHESNVHFLCLDESGQPIQIPDL